MTNYYAFNENAANSITETLTIADGQVRLRHIPQEASVTIAGFVETNSLTLSGNKFRVDYYDATGNYRDASRRIFFDTAKNGTRVTVKYTAVGTPVTAADMNEIKSHLENATLHGGGGSGVELSQEHALSLYMAEDGLADDFYQRYYDRYPVYIDETVDNLDDVTRWVTGTLVFNYDCFYLRWNGLWYPVPIISPTQKANILSHIADSSVHGGGTNYLGSTGQVPPNVEHIRAIQIYPPYTVNYELPLTPDWHSQAFYSESIEDYTCEITLDSAIEEESQILGVYSLSGQELSWSWVLPYAYRRSPSIQILESLLRAKCGLDRNVPYSATILIKYEL